MECRSAEAVEHQRRIERKRGEGVDSNGARSPLVIARSHDRDPGREMPQRTPQIRLVKWPSAAHRLILAHTVPAHDSIRPHAAAGATHDSSSDSEDHLSCRQSAPAFRRWPCPTIALATGDDDGPGAMACAQRANAANADAPNGGMNKLSIQINILSSGGEGGIRTLGTLACTTVFETAPFDRSGTSPHAVRRRLRGVGRYPHAPACLKRRGH